MENTEMGNFKPRRKEHFSLYIYPEMKAKVRKYSDRMEMKMNPYINLVLTKHFNEIEEAERNFGR